MFKRIIKLKITFSRNRPIRGSSYIPLPEGLKGKPLINAQNKKDHHCFKWAILRHIHPRKVHPEGISDLKEHVDELNWDGIELISNTVLGENVQEVRKEYNNMFLVVFGHGIVNDGMKKKKEICIIPLYVPTPTERRERVVRLFFLRNKDGESHYWTITNMSGLVSRQVIRNRGRIYVCDYCLNHFGIQSLLDKHEESCSKYKAVKTEYPKPGENILKFKNIQNCLECPIKFYFDTESILKPINEVRGKTKLCQRHVISAFCLYPVSRIEGFSMEPITYVAKDEHDEVDKILVEKMVETAKNVYENFKIPAKMILDEYARKLHESATVCFACGKEFDGDKVRDHYHYTGKYRGALHSKCNLKLGGKTLIIPVLAHNNSGNESHMIVKRLSDTEGRVSCIAENEEKYITFSKDIMVDVVNEKNVYVRLKFLDTFRFMDKNRLLKCISKPNFGGAFIFENSQFVSVRMRPSTVRLDKPIQHGVSVLDRTKVPMYEWHYGCMKQKYGNNAKAGYTDTDSFIYEIHTEDVFENTRSDVPTMFDTSAYPEDHPAGLSRMNKKVPGLTKDEACGRIITKAVCLGPK